jgi:hypothetical protein
MATTASRSISWARPMTTSARVFPRQADVRPDPNRASCPRRASSSATLLYGAITECYSAAWRASASPCATWCGCRGRGHGRPRLRIHDGRRGVGSARRDATSRPACQAASPTCSTRTAPSSGAAISP